jgi:hypothetical protein
VIVIAAIPQVSIKNAEAENCDEQYVIDRFFVHAMCLLLSRVGAAEKRKLLTECFYYFHMQ